MTCHGAYCKIKSARSPKAILNNHSQQADNIRLARNEANGTNYLLFKQSFYGAGNAANTLQSRLVKPVYCKWRKGIECKMKKKTRGLGNRRGTHLKVNF